MFNSVIFCLFCFVLFVTETLDPGQGILAQILKKEAPCCVFVQRSTSSTAGDSLRAEIRKQFSHIIVLHDLRQESSVDSAINKYKVFDLWFCFTHN
jgi:hypothetical protein